MVRAANNQLPTRPYSLPLSDMNHDKRALYVEFPLIVNATVTKEVFYVEREFTFVTSDTANTTLYKWNSGVWTAITGLSNPDILYGRGFYAVDTAADAYVTITEHATSVDP